MTNVIAATSMDWPRVTPQQSSTCTTNYDSRVLPRRARARSTPTIRRYRAFLRQRGRRELDQRHHREASALTDLGSALADVRRFDEAIEAGRRSLTIFQELGDRGGQTRALNNLGSALQAAGSRRP